MSEINLEAFCNGRADPNLVLNELDKVDSEQSLRQFLELAWPILEPGRAFCPGWHIDAVCDHLEAVSRGEITRLLINVPPGCMKSLTTEVFWPAWEWGPRNKPNTSYVSASYSEALTVRDNRKCRTLIQSDWYQTHWGDRFHLVSDQNAKVRFDTDKMGFKIATSVAGLGTGERGDRFIIDDPHNVKEGESEAVRGAALLWFTEVVPTRMRDPETSSIVIIMQRVHDQDISGYVIAHELGYEQLILPMEYEAERHCKTIIGFSDPREDENELLWPKRMTRAVIERDKKVLGSYAYAGQFQQRPSPRGGGMFKREWFEVVDAIPAGPRRIIRSWDLAATETDNAAWTAGIRISKTTDGIFYIEHVHRFRGSPEKVDRALLNTASQDGMGVTIRLPQDPGQAGKSQKKYLASLLVGYDVRFKPETGSKELRAQALSAQAEAGNVKVVRGDWNGIFFDEICSFPVGAFKDQVDAAANGFNELISKQQSKVPVAPTLIELA